jgi:hypothetical protein
MVPHFYVFGFGMKNWVLCYTYGTSACNMSILLTKVTHGVCDPKELIETTSCSNILCLGSGLSNTQLFAGRRRHQIRSQELASPRSGLPIQPTSGKIRVWKNHEAPKKTQSTKDRSRECDASTWICAWLPVDAKSLEMLENERTNISRTGCLTSSPSSRGVTQSCFGTPSSPRVHLSHPHQEL